MEPLAVESFRFTNLYPYMELLTPYIDKNSIENEFLSELPQQGVFLDMRQKILRKFKLSCKLGIYTTFEYI